MKMCKKCALCGVCAVFNNRSPSNPICGMASTKTAQRTQNAHFLTKNKI